ncbi:unnamed protein product [Darwinula stevensoni]|uniref:Proteasome assembly chaperone 2 n=1 Tax=Darwinula stevensoni TaxID=69355 RepID=A0A7R9A9Q2_9CRUS|nr:unnamed protein product [Darwinula stevensoni]CAG0897642.1 unnamed protein product [Darwinula stevensoni]
MSGALNTLTEAYTDSEGEDEGGADSKDIKGHSTGSPQHTSSAGNSSAASTPSKGTPSSSMRNKPSLVPEYIDAGIIDGEEEDHIPEAMDISEEEEESMPASDPDVAAQQSGREDIEGEKGEGEQGEVEDRVVTADPVIINKDGVEVRLPPEPPGECSAKLLEKFRRLNEKKERGALDMNDVIQRRKDFRNPSIYDKLLQYCGIDEHGTNFPPELYDPHRWGEHSYYDELARVQKLEMEKREKERKERTKVEFVSGMVKKMGVASGGIPEKETKERRSKWDQVGSKPPLISMIPPPGLANRPIVIPAYGAIKKPKTLLVLTLVSGFLNVLERNFACNLGTCSSETESSKVLRMPGAVEFFHRHSSSSGLEGTAGFTLVMPSVSVGNVGQLSMDLIIGSVVGEKVGCLYHEAILPFAGPHPFQLHSTPTLSTSCEVYKDTGRKLLLLQIRSPILQHKRKEFVESLISWIKTLSVDRIVVLTSCFDYERNDEQIRGSPLRFMATPPTLQQRLEKYWILNVLLPTAIDIELLILFVVGVIQ